MQNTIADAAVPKVTAAPVRRMAPRLLAAALALMSAGTAAPCPAHAGVSTTGTAAMFRCDPAHDGVCDTRGIGHVGGPYRRPLWRFRTGQLNRSTPAVAGGMVYVGSDSGYLYALNAADGQLKWRFTTQGELNSSPTCDHGRVYFTGGDGDVYALDARDGHRLWMFRTGPLDGKRPEWDFFQSSPVVADGVVYVGSGDGKVYALDAQTGAQRWAFRTDGVVRSSPAVAGGTVYVGSMGGTLYALDARDGRKRWSFKTQGNKDFPLGEIQSTPAVADGTVYFGSRDSTLYALDAKTGAQRWADRDPQGAWVISGPAVAHGTVYFATSDSHRIEAVDAASGKTRWNVDAGGRVFASPVLVGTRLYLGLADGEAVWMDKATGKLLGEAPSEGTIYGSVAVSDGVIYYASDDGYVYAAK